MARRSLFGGLFGRKEENEEVVENKEEVEETLENIEPALEEIKEEAEPVAKEEKEETELVANETTIEEEKSEAEVVIEEAPTDEAKEAEVVIEEAPTIEAKEDDTVIEDVPTIEVNKEAPTEDAKEEKKAPKPKAKKAPKKEEKPAKQQKTDDEDSDEEEDDNEEDVEEEATEVGFNKNVLLKLKGASTRVQTMYSDLRNALQDYKQLKFKSNNTGDTYALKGKVIIKVTIFPKALKVYFALDPNAYPVSRFHHKDMSEIKRYESIPLRLRVASERGYKYALELVDELVKKEELIRSNVKDVDFKENFSATSKELLEAYNGGDFIKENCSKEESNALPDSLAKKGMLYENREPFKGEKVWAEISVGELSAAFKSSYVIDLNLLKDVGLVDKEATHLRITSKNNCYKAITVKADDFENEAMKMIMIAGGNVIKMIN